MLRLFRNQVTPDKPLRVQECVRWSVKNRQSDWLFLG